MGLLGVLAAWWVLLGVWLSLLGKSAPGWADLAVTLGWAGVLAGAAVVAPKRSAKARHRAP